MTRFGKILVLLNVAICVMLAAWSFSLHANGVDWTDKKPNSQFSLRAAKLGEMWKGVAPNQLDWLRERARLEREEKQLADERAWYDKEMQFVQIGQTRGNPVKEVAMAVKDTEQNIDGDRVVIRKGDVLLDEKGYPRLVPILDLNNAPLPLQSLAEYNVENDRVVKDIAQKMKEHEAQIEEATALTVKIVGDKTKGIRGLQQRINDEQAKAAAVLAEMKLVEPQLINTLVEAQLINKRHDQMVKRIEELKKVKVAGR